MIMLAAQTHPSSPRPSRTHIPALDGVRGIAIVLVMIFHFNTRVFLRVVNDAGWVGVDLFFVLSGFLITGILLDNKDDRHYFRNFYARRTLRIFPLYYGVLGIYTSFWLWRGNHAIVREMAWLWPYLTNVRIGMNNRWTSYWLNHFWSLAVEEHFYLVWPAVILWLGRKSLMRVCVALMLIALALRCALFLRHDFLTAYVLTPCRMDALAAGSWLAAAVRGPTNPQTFRRVGLFALAGTGAVLACMYIPTNRLDNTDPRVYTIGLTLLAIASTGLIALIVSTPTGRLARYFSISPLRWLGKYSYGLYVLHPIMTQLPAISYGWPPRFAFIPQLICAIAGAWLSWNLYEKHFLKLKRFFAPRPKTAGSPSLSFLAPVAAAQPPALQITAP
jgi:peptidoglycan/LPS O-acetylase OafA/YrhL